MTTLHPLLLNAIDSCLCAPNEESQFIFQLARMSNTLGVYDFYNENGRTIELPIKGRWWSIYKLGSVLPAYVTETLDLSKWVNVKDIINQTDTLCEFYTGKGFIYPKSDIWMADIGEGSIIVAVMKIAAIDFRPSKEPLFLRVYRNPFFDNNTNVTEKLTTDGVTVSSLSDAVNFKNSKPVGKGVSLYRNGWCVKDFDLAKIKKDDRLEWVSDDTIEDVVKFQVADLTTFVSLLDRCAKLILFSTTGADGTVRHERDIDVYVEDSVTGLSVLLHRNDPSVIRMIDYRDYALKESALRALLNTFPASTTYSKLNIVLKRRKSGFDVTPIDDSDCFIYVNHLPDSKIRGVVNGASAQLPRWSAARLEKSPYTKLLGSKIPELTVPSVIEAYGYGWVNKTLANSIRETNMVSFDYDIPPAFQSGMFALEYNGLGRLIRYKNVPDTSLEFLSTDCKLVEMVEGQYVEITSPSDIWLARGVSKGYVPTPKKEGYRYRFYHLVHDVLLGVEVLVDVTDSDDYDVIDGSYRWKLNNTPSVIERYVVSDEVSTILKFNLKTIVGEDKVIKVGSDLPLLTDVFDVYVDGKALVPNIEFTTNKDSIHLLSVEAMNGDELIIVQSGFPVLEGEKSFIKSETGFTYNGLLSPNKRTKLFENKVQKLIVDGVVIIPNPLQLSEYSTNGPLGNGKPYHIRDVFSPMRGLLVGDPYKLYSDSILVEDEVLGYLKQNAVYPTPLPTTTINGKLNLFSPFIDRVVWKLRSNTLPTSVLGEMQGVYSDGFVTSVVSEYLWLLAYLETSNNEIDMEYCVVSPHSLQSPVELNEWKYSFLERVINIYSSRYVTINGDVLINPSLP